MAVVSRDQGISRDLIITRIKTGFDYLRRPKRFLYSEKVQLEFSLSLGPRASHSPDLEVEPEVKEIQFEEPDEAVIAFSQK